MSRLSSQAIVLKTSNYGEYDRIVSLYTKHFGKIRGIAKGAKRSQRRFGGTLEPFTVVTVYFVDKEHHGLCRLERCELVRAFPEIADNVTRVAYGAYFLELIEALTPEKEQHADIFSLLLFFISLLTTAAFREELARLFELRLFTHLGYQPHFASCVACGGAFKHTGSYKFSVKRGGIVCGRCQERFSDLLPLSLGTIKIFQQAQNLSLGKLNRLFFSETAYQESTAIFSRFLEYHMGKRPKSLDILKQAL